MSKRYLHGTERAHVKVVQPPVHQRVPAEALDNAFATSTCALSSRKVGHQEPWRPRVYEQVGRVQHADLHRRHLVRESVPSCAWLQVAPLTWCRANFGQTA